MPFGTATVTFDLKKLLGTDVDTRRTKVWLSTNVDRDIVNDETGEFRLALDTVTVNADGSVSFTVPTPSGTTNPTTWQTRVHIDAATIYSERIKRTLGPFTITANALLSDLVDEQEVPPEYLTTLTQQLDGKVNEAEAARAAAEAAALEAGLSAAEAETVGAAAGAAAAEHVATAPTAEQMAVVATDPLGNEFKTALSAQQAANITAAGDVRDATDGRVSVGIAEEVPGLVADGRSALAAAAFPAGRVALYIGESTPTGAGSTSNSQYGIQAILPQYVGTARLARYGESINGAVDGRKVADVLADFEALLDANPRVGVVICNVGTNDASAATPLADFAAAYVQLIDTAKRRGIPFVATTATPRTSAWTNQATWTPRYNAWITDYCRRKGVPLADWHGALVDPTTGFIQSALAAGDTVHPNNAGHRALAAVTAPILKALLTLPVWLPAYGPQSNGLVANPLMAGGSGTTMPTNWFTNPQPPPGSYTRGTEDPVPGDGLPGGKWFFLELNNTAGSSAVYAETRHANITSGVSPGDQLRVYAHIKADPTGQYDKVGIRLRSGTTVLTAPFYRLVTPDPAPHVWDFVAGSAGSPLVNINVGLEITADVGQRARAAIGAVQVYNRTTGQLVGLP